MSAQPPPSERPTGPPSGPLSGPSQPGSTPPPGPVPPEPPPSGGGFGGTGGPGGAGGPGGTGGPGGPAKGPGEGPGHPWWRSAPRIAAVAAALVAAVVLTIVFTRPESAKAGEVVLEPAGSTGPDPYTESTARESSPPPTLPRLPSSSETPANATRSVRGSTPGLYTGTRKVASCDVEKQISSLTADPAKNRAFASVHGIAPAAVPGFLRSLTPVQLGMDTRVTNHGYKNGASTSYQAVLQAGTAVLVDARGVPQVRCGCGNPLGPVVPTKGTPQRKGDPWPAYRPSNVVVVAPSVTVVNVFIVFDPHKNDWFARDRGDTDGRYDKRTPPPARIELPRFPDTSSPSPGKSSPSPGKSSPSPGSSSPSPGKSSPSPGSSSPSPDRQNLQPESSEPPAPSPPSPGEENPQPQSSEPPAYSPPEEAPPSDASLPAPPPPAVPEPPPESAAEPPLQPDAPVS
ncbi:DUF6777 domain-containing protein [Streptomyces sp. NPDC060064]|uniref:DUF6777 domain-containing protein n=1 Tax=Streptomyces sp. NPDC060064 TaxID=3347049 RepID=UPI00367C7B03